jgi:molybdopterin molybdotransferase
MLPGNLSWPDSDPPGKVKAMITYEEARAIVLEHANPLGVELFPLKEITGMVLAEPVLAPHDLPLFDNSAVDGFGIRLTDVESASNEKPVRLKLLGTIQAGDSSTLSVQQGTVIKILTGAPIPSNVEAVIMQEFSESENGSVSLIRGAEAGENIRYRGEEYRSGDIVLEAHTVITPPVVGLLASLGYDSIHVYRKPRISILVTGNELIHPGQQLSPGQIYESNSYSLISALGEMGLATVTVKIIKDNENDLQVAMSLALTESDIVISTGGVSVGEFDLVKDIAESLGVETLFWKVAIKPGKPVLFGKKDINGRQKLIFGLPGNPVSVLVTFFLFVQPLLLQMTGLKSNSISLQKARLSSDLKKKPGRLDFVRGKLENAGSSLTVKPCMGQGSHMLGGLAQADCLILFHQESSFITTGTEVDVIPLQWGKA